MSTAKVKCIENFENDYFKVGETYDMNIEIKGDTDFKTIMKISKDNTFEADNCKFEVIK